MRCMRTRRQSMKSCSQKDMRCFPMLCTRLLSILGRGRLRLLYLIQMDGRRPGLCHLNGRMLHVDPVVSDGGNLYSVQKTADGAWLFRANAVPAKGWQQYAVLPRTDEKTKELVYRESGTLAASLHHLENDYLKVTLDPNGQSLRSMIKKQGGSF